MFIASRATQAMNTNRTAGGRPVITSNSAGGASTDLTSAAIAEAELDSELEETGGTPVSTHVSQSQFFPLSVDDSEREAYLVAYGGEDYQPVYGHRKRGGYVPAADAWGLDSDIGGDEYE